MKARLTKLFTLLTILTLGITNVWGVDYNLINDNDDASTATLNTDDFWTQGTFSAKSNGGDLKKCIVLGGNISAGVTNINYPTRYISYGVKTTSVTITIKAYQSNNSAKKINIYEVNEAANGSLTVSNTKEVSVSKGLQTINFTAAPAAGTRSTIYITSQAASNFEFYQVTASETGSALTNLVGGRDGYAIDYSKKSRLATKSGETAKLDGIEYYKLASDYKPNNTQKVVLKTGGYIKFNTIEPIVLTIVTTTAQKFYVAQTVDGTTNPKEAAATHKIKLSAAGDWYIIGGSSSATDVSSIAFSVPTISYDKNDEGADGTMSSNTWTVAANGFTAPSGKKFDKWNTKADGSGDDVAVDAELLENTTLYAQWKADIAEYTVTYKDGESVLKSVSVACGKTPDAYIPTKEFYTFANWDVDPSTLGPTPANTEVVLNASWTAQYTSGTYEFTGHLTMGTVPNQMVIENNSDGKDYTAGRIDNIYVSAQKIGYEATGNYGGWKLKTTNGTLRFLVENACGVRVTLGEANPLRIAYTEGGVAKTADIAKSTTSSVYKADANSLVTLTNITSGNKTVTLKKIEILPLYNATYSDEKGDASGSDENVTEVTLPTPSETTVGSYSFTGWVANQTVYDGETPKTTGEALTAGGTYALTATTTFTAQWALIADFDVKFFQGYGDPDVQIGETQSISTGGHAVAPADPTRTGFAFLGWSYDATEAHIVDVATYGITAATNFTAMWKQVWTVTFDGAGNVNVENGETVASPNSPVMAGKVFQGWYNGESKYDFSAAVTGNLALESKWAVADPNHFYYTYNDDFHFDGVVYKTPDGKTKDPEAAEASNVALETNPYTLFSGTAGITSIIATNGIYDYKKAAGTKHITAYLKLKADDATSNVVFTIASGYTAVLKLKMNGYSSNATISLKKGDDAVTPSGTQEGTAEGKNYGELTYNLTAGEYKLTTANKTLYISHIDLEATALPTHTVTYKAGEGTGDDVVDNDATEVRDGSTMFTAPTGQVFNGWKDESDNDVEVGAIVSADMTLTAQWINHYAVTFNMNGHGDAIDPQDIKEGAKATRPDDPIAIGFDFGGWFTDEECTAGNEFDFNTPITAATPLYAKWTAFDGCTLLVPATSGEALTVGATVDLQTGSTGGSIMVAGLNGEGTIAYNTKGLSFSNGGKDSILVTLNNELKNGSVIKVRLMANGGTKDNGRGLNLLNAARVKKALLGWQANEEVTLGDVGEFTYTVVESDGFAGTNVFTLQRQNSVFLQSIKVENCGAAITYHDLTSAVDPAGKGTVTLGASSVREGYTTTATYSEIDPLYEFVNWTVSGVGASIADASANPATITMGTEDAVVTLNLRLIPVKFTVNYYDGTTLMGSEQVAVNEHPTASEIETAKRGYVFEGWAETDGASASDVVALNTITSDVAATIDLYAVYTAVPCPTSGTVYKFQLKTDLTNGNVFDSKPNSAAFTTGNYLSELTGGTLTGAIDNNNVNRLQFYDNKAVGFASGSGGSLTIALDCALAEGDVIKYINYASSGNRMTLSDGTHTQTLDGNGKEEIQTWDVPAAWAGAMDLTLTRGGNTPKLTYFEINRRPVATGVTLSDLTVRVGAKKTPEMTLAPSADARVNSQAWTITSGDTYITIDAATGEITGVAEGDATVKVVLNDDPSISATATVHVVGSIAQQDVTKSTVWDWHNTGATANIQLTNTSDPQKNEQFVLANVDVDNDEDFESDKLVVEGEYMVRDYNKANPYFQGQLIKFNSTVAGIIRVKFSNTGGNPARELYINGVGTGNSSTNTTLEWSDYVEVPVGEVSITAYLVDKSEDIAQKYIRVSEIEFFALGHSRDVTPGNLGTLCLPNACIARGVDVYELVGKEATYGKIVFADLEPDDLLVAGKAYIFQVNEATARFYYNTDPAVGTPDNSTALKGNLASTTIIFQPNTPEAENVYFVKDHALWSAKETGVKIGQYRAYLQMNEVTAVTSSSPPAPGRRYIMLGTNGQNQAQGIDDVQDDVRSTKMLIDGRLFILRGEKIYDATGRLVK